MSLFFQEENRLLTLTLKNCKNADKFCAITVEELRNLTSWLRMNGYETAARCAEIHADRCLLCLGLLFPALSRTALRI